MKLAEISIKRPSLVIVLFTLLISGGLFSYHNLGYELLPNFDIKVVTIATVYPGASPNEVENTITKKIEDAVSSLGNIKKIDAQSYESLSVISITLTSDADAEISLNDAQRKVNAILSDLPSDVLTPSLSKFSLSGLPIMTIGANAKMDEIAFYDLIEKKLTPILSRVKGVAQVNIVGGQEREIEVQLDAKKIQAYKISVEAIKQNILSSNIDFPTGSIRTREKKIIIRLEGKYKSVDELRNLIISTHQNGVQIRLKDVADVQDGKKNPEKIARINQKSAIILQIIKQSGANAVSVSEEITKKVASLQEEYKSIALNLNIASDSTTYQGKRI